MKTIYDVPVLLRREIEALMVKPFLDAFEKELGHDRTYEIAASVIKEIAEDQGSDYAKMGGNDLNGLLEAEKAWNANDALEAEDVVEDGCILHQTVKRCAYVDMYTRIGMRELGYMLSCLRDEFFYKGFNPDMIMTRSKTIMTGSGCCDFCFRFPKRD